MSRDNSKSSTSFAHLSDRQPVALVGSITPRDDVDGQLGVSKSYNAQHHSQRSVIAGFIILSFFTSLPSMFAGFLASLNKPLDGLQTFGDVKDLLSNAHSDGSLYWPGIPTGACALLNFMVLSYVNYLELYQLYKKSAASPSPENSKVLNAIIFTWPLITAISYAEYGRMLFRFLSYGSYVPFALNLFLFFSFRLVGTRFVLNMNSKMNRFKNRLITQAETYPNYDFVNVRIPGDVNATNAAITQLVDHNFNHVPMLGGKRKVSGYFYLAADILGALSVVVLATAIWPTMAQKMMAGLESLTFDTLDLGKSNNYQEWWSIVPGDFLVAPTPFFYGMTCLLLFREFVNTGMLIGKNIKEKKNDRAKLMVMTTLISGFSSYMGSVGLQGLVLSVVSHGFLKYLGITADNEAGKYFVRFGGWLGIVVAQCMYQKLINRSIGCGDLNAARKLDIMDVKYLITYFPQVDLSQSKAYQHYQPESCCAKLKCCKPKRDDSEFVAGLLASAASQPQYQSVLVQTLPAASQPRSTPPRPQSRRRGRSGVNYELDRGTTDFPQGASVDSDASFTGQGGEQSQLATPRSHHLSMDSPLMQGGRGTGADLPDQLLDDNASTPPKLSPESDHEAHLGRGTRSIS